MLFYANIGLSRFSRIIKKNISTILYHSIENLTSYKMVYKTLRKNVTLHSNIENTLEDLNKPASGHDLFDSVYNYISVNHSRSDIFS